MRDHDRPDVETAILDHLVGRQIESRAWPAPPEDRRVEEAGPRPPPAADRTDDPDVLADVADAMFVPASEYRGAGEGRAAQPDVADPDAAVSEAPSEVSSPLPFGEEAEPSHVPEPRADADAGAAAVAAQGEVETTTKPAGKPEPVDPAADAGDDEIAGNDDLARSLADSVAEAEALALRSLLAECGSLLQWVCSKAEQGTLSHGDIARARAFLAMSGLPTASGRRAES